METLAQIRQCLPTKRSSKSSTLFRKPNRNYFHTNHSRHKLKDGLRTVKVILESSHLYYIGLVLFILISAISTEVISSSSNFYNTSLATTTRQTLLRPQRSPRGQPLTRSNKEHTSEAPGTNVSTNFLRDSFGQKRSVCSGWCDREERINYTLSIIKAEILEKLGLTHPPNATGFKVPNIPQLQMLQQRGNPQEITDMIGDQPFKSKPNIHQEDENYQIKKETIFVSPKPLKLRHDRQTVLHFHFSEKNMENGIEKAVLHFWLKGLDDDEGDLPVLISLKTVSKNESQAENLTVAQSEKKTRPKSTDWEQFNIDVTSLVAQWFRNPHTNLGIVIEAVPLGLKERYTGEPLVSTEDNGKGNMPLLEIHLKEKEKHRKKRDTALTCDANSSEVNCCRYPLLVDFEKLDWQFVIAPKRYEAYYCSGECPFVYLPMNPHTHLRQMTENSDKLKPCCAPKKVSSLSMLYFDGSGAIIYGVVPGMAVDRCGCV